MSITRSKNVSPAAFNPVHLTDAYLRYWWFGQERIVENNVIIQEEHIGIGTIPQNPWVDETKSDAGFQDWCNDRLRAMTDLFWLGTDILGYAFMDDFFCHCQEEGIQTASESVPCTLCGQDMQMSDRLPGMEHHLHREICNFFVQKNPRKQIHKQDEQKDRLLMVPRGSFKSSIDEADCVQWILAFPDVRIGILTAAEDLAIMFVDKVKDFFIQRREVIDPTHFSRLQFLFPDHVVVEKGNDKGASGEFTTPARTDEAIHLLKEPTIAAIGLTASSAGWHFDVGKYDDCVSNTNSGPTADQTRRDKTRESIDNARQLIELYGYHDNLGTPWDEADAYAYWLAKKDILGLKTLIHPCWVVKDEFRLVPEKERTEEMYWFLFRVDGKGFPRLTFKELKKKRDNDLHIFSCQFLCDPASVKIVKFTEDLIRQHITQAGGLPQTYKCFSAWDFAAADPKAGNDFSVGVVGWFDEIGRMFVMDVIRGRFSPSELAYAVASQAQRWHVECIYIESSPGATFLSNDITRALINLSYDTCPMEFFKVDNTKDAKNLRAMNLEALLVSGRLWFSAGLELMDTIIQEFVVFKPHSKRKDDIVDAIAHCARNIQPGNRVPQTTVERQQKMWDLLALKTDHDMIYCQGKYESLNKNRPPDPNDIIVLPLPTEYDGHPIACQGCGYNPCICQ